MFQPKNAIALLLDSSGPGGIESHVLSLAELLHAKGVPVIIVFLRYHGENMFIQRLRQTGICFHFLNGRLTDLYRYLRQEKPRLVHTHGYKSNIIGRVFCRLTGTPVVSTFHAGERGQFPVNLYQFVDDWTSFVGTRIAVSKELADRMPFKTAVVANFISHRPQNELIHNQVPRIAFVGRLSPEKGPDRFCRMAKKLGQAARWEVFGDGPMKERLQEAYSDHVIFHGFKRTPDEIYSGVDLLVMPSRAEGLPMAALEAMSFGIPLVASDLGGLSSLVINGKTGWLLPTTDDKACEDEAISVIGDWLQTSLCARNQMCLAARQHVTEAFGEDQAWDRFRTLYSQAGGFRS